MLCCRFGGGDRERLVDIVETELEDLYEETDGDRGFESVGSNGGLAFLVVSRVRRNSSSFRPRSPLFLWERLLVSRIFYGGAHLVT